MAFGYGISIPQYLHIVPDETGVVTGTHMNVDVPSVHVTEPADTALPGSLSVSLSDASSGSAAETSPTNCSVRGPSFKEP